MQEMKYQKIFADIKNKIKSGYFKANQVLPSENELSEKYNVSRYSVRKAYDILEEQGYIYAEHGKGRFLSEQMIHLKKSKNIAVITTYIADYIFPHIIEGIDDFFSEKQFHLVLKSTHNIRKKEVACLEEILRNDFEGIIIEPSRSQIYCHHKNLYEQFDKYNIPYVFIQGIYKQLPNAPYVVADDLGGSYLLTEYLIKQNHKKIVGIFKSDDYQGQERHKGYAKALQDYGLLYDPELVVWFSTEDYKIQPYNEIENLLRKYKDIDGVVCYNDQVATEVIETAEKINLSVPDDISVTGFDDAEIDKNYKIRLTTVTHPLNKLGEKAAELLFKLMQGETKLSDEQKHILIKSELVIGKSTKRRS